MSSSGKHKSPSDHERQELGKRARPSFSQGSIVCLIEGCGADLSGSKDYHQRHKVCEVHARAATALHKGQVMRFCQQCSRFHPLTEFDEGKRSCRRRLLGHNKRRRKKDDAASEPDESPARSSPRPAAGAFAPPSDAHQAARRRLAAPEEERPPPRHLGQGLSLAPFAPRDAVNGGAGPSLALSQFLRDSGVGVAHRTSVAPLSTMLLGAPPQTADFLGRTQGLSASQQLLLGYQTRHHSDPQVKVEATNTLQLHFPARSPSHILRAVGARQSPSLQQLLDKSAPSANLGGRNGIAGPEPPPSTLFPLPGSLSALGEPAAPPWAGHLEGLVDAGRGPGLGPPPGAYLPYDRTGRISFKLFDKNPNDLPDDLRDQILDWLQRRPSAMETYLRPGCVHVSAYLAMPQRDWDALLLNLPAALGALVQRAAWARGSFTATVDNMVAVVEQGAIRQVRRLPQGQGPIIHSVRPRWIVAGQPVEISVIGQGLLEPNTRVVCLHDGQRFLDSCPTVGPARPSAALAQVHALSWSHQNDGPAAMAPFTAHNMGTKRGGLDWSPRAGGITLGPSSWSQDPLTGVETVVWTMAAPAAGSSGAMFVEVDRAGVPSNMTALLVADAAVCAELAALEAYLEGSGCPGSAARQAAEARVNALVTDLGWALGGADDGNKSARLAAFAEQQGWHATTERVACRAGRKRSVEAIVSSGATRGAGERGANVRLEPPTVQGHAAPDTMLPAQGLNKERKGPGAESDRVNGTGLDCVEAAVRSPVVQPLMLQSKVCSWESLHRVSSQRMLTQAECIVQAGPMHPKVGAGSSVVTFFQGMAAACALVCPPSKAFPHKIRQCSLAAVCL